MRRAKRRALLVSISAQFVFLAALILSPLLSRGERLNIKLSTPVVPFGNPHSASTQHRAGGGRTATHRTGTINYNNLNAQHPVTHPPEDDGPVFPDAPIGNGDPISVAPAGDSSGIIDPNAHNGPVKPSDDTKPPKKVVRVSTHLEPAQLITRIEPIYPSIAKQTRREGTVILRAIIARDGSVQSLEVVSGDPLFIRSALDAVSHWVYRPTFLSGEPVEVDTQITVVYRLEK